MNPEFWRSRRVFLTGHTGFKGSWLSLWLQNMGAEVFGYSLAPPTNPNLFEQILAGAGMKGVTADIGDLECLRRAVAQEQPEIIFHLAAQSLVRHSYADPTGTFRTNVLGTVHVLEAVRDVPSIRSVVIITSDKCYENLESGRAYRETDRLGGADPYSASKAAAELIVTAYRKSFFATAGREAKVGVASARAGNVVGGGDWAEDRLVPDAMRALLEGRRLQVRNPKSIRPWQHVLDPLCGYLTLAERLYQSPAQFSEAWNFGPELSACVPVLAILERLRELWGPEFAWEIEAGPHPPEAECLKLDCSKAKALLGWEPVWDLERSLAATVEWYRAHQSGRDLRSITEAQIHSFSSPRSLPEVSAR